MPQVVMLISMFQPFPDDPQATLNKMMQIKSAALAPAEPSAQDPKVAASRYGGCRSSQ